MAALTKESLGNRSKRAPSFSRFLTGVRNELFLFRFPVMMFGQVVIIIASNNIDTA